MPSLVITRSPTASLVVLFLAWKLLLLTIAYFSPGPGYDTSTQLLFRSRGFGDLTLPLKHDDSQSITRVPITGASLWLLQALTRWDAIYFASISERGYILEQEWAFGWGFTRLLSFLATSMFIFPRFLPTPSQDIRAVVVTYWPLPSHMLVWFMPTLTFVEMFRFFVLANVSQGHCAIIPVLHDVYNRCHRLQIVLCICTDYGLDNFINVIA